MAKRFCANGHDTFECGRLPGGCCKQCNRERVQRHYWSLTPEARRARNAARNADLAADRAVLREERNARRI